MNSNKTPDWFKSNEKLKRNQKCKGFNSPMNLNDSRLAKAKNKSLGSLNSSIVRTPNATPSKLNESQLPQTPECFANVNLETPRRNASLRERNLSGNLSKLDVAVRIRPMNERELKTVGSTNVVSVEDDVLTVVTTTDSTSENKHQFFYDYILESVDEDKDNFANQTKVYDTIGCPLLDSAFEGYNTCLFAYGQTGSGKSYSMMGTEDNAGIIPRFCEDLFARIKANSALHATVEVSYFEIYNEKVHDLLSSAVDGNVRSTPLNVREHPIWGPYVVDLSIHPVNSFPSLWNWLIIGNNQRAVASTTMNDKSSRSHSIFSIVLTISNESDSDKKVSRQSKINLVDLAGSERLGNVKMNDERLRQSVSINKSLLTLGKVIAALAEHKRFPLYVPYRESVLTWLLRESLGGNSRTCMLATITPASCNVEETLSTLRYASKARNIVNRVRINEDPQDKIIRELRAEVERLQALKQEYQRQSLSSSLNTTSPKSSINETVEEKSICTIENTNGIFHVDVSNLTSNTCLIEDDIVLNNGDKLVIEGGSSFNIEKLEVFGADHEDKENLNTTNFQEQSLNIEELNQSIAKLEKYCKEIEEKNKISSTLDFPNNISPYRDNFFTELEEILTSVNSPVKNFSTVQVAAVHSPVSPIKSACKQDKNTITKCLTQIQENTQTVAKLASEKPEVLAAIRTIEDAVKSIKKELKSSNKSVKFWLD